jgi:hypothetical protein
VGAAKQAKWSHVGLGELVGELGWVGGNGGTERGMEGGQDLAKLW